MTKLSNLTIYIIKFSGQLPLEEIEKQSEKYEELLEKAHLWEFGGYDDPFHFVKPEGGSQRPDGKGVNVTSDLFCHRAIRRDPRPDPPHAQGLNIGDASWKKNTAFLVTKFIKRGSQGDSTVHAQLFWQESVIE
ncbi:hypothetical protein B9Z19DRAFT_1124365 [Tuber borchii]|uniref:Uncharacterized protein n=1 Tax=Tuber borchii TaxID=42251 RepID=A0A2T6ZWV6_TUBBO|nr:hypothetical protein B9Z19DRAFT_1124365 [Tuber borchii]